MMPKQLRGEVVERRDGVAIVQLDEAGRCDRGTICCGCGSAVGPPRRLKVLGGSLQVGDRVEVSIPGWDAYVGILSLFVLPVVLFVVGAAVGTGFEAPGGSYGTPTVVGGLLGFGAAAAVGIGVNRLVDRPGRYPVRRVD
jgi:positive regulator of sigma E activity